MKALLSFLLPGVLLLCADHRSCTGQEFWRHFGRPDLGFSVNFYRLTNPDETEDEDEFNLIHMCPQIGLNIPIIPLAEHLRIGLNPGVGLSAQPFGDTYDPFTGDLTSSTLAIEVPLYATLKFNTDATWKGSKSTFGCAAGIGAHYNAFFFLRSGVNAGYFQPSYMLEANFGSRRGKGGLFKLRWTSYIGTHMEEIEEFDDDLRIGFHQFAIGLHWVPGY